MRGWVKRRFTSIVTAAHDNSIENHNRSYRNFPNPLGPLGLCEGLTHPPKVIIRNNALHQQHTLENNNHEGG